MAGALRKTMEYLGLAETDEYDARRYGAGDHDEHDEGYHAVDGGWDDVDDEGRRLAPAGHDDGDDATDAEGAERRGYGRVTPLHPRTVGGRSGSRVMSAPEQHADLRRITTIHPRTYNEAKNIGENFRAGIPVIMNLTDMTDADAKRLVDFSAGLVFGLHGSIERVTNKVFLLSPEHVEVTAESVPARPTHLFNQS